MNLQTPKATGRTKKHTAARRRGNGEVRNAQHDSDVISMVEAELEKRAADLHAMVADGAYFRAERRGFAAGHELDDWLAAEAEIVNQSPSRTRVPSSESESES